MLPRLLASLCLAALASCASPRTSPPPVAPTPLAAAVSARLTLAQEVAWAKYRNGLPVFDPAREAVVLAAAESRGATFGLAPARAREIIAAQIAASSAQQREFLRRWSRGGPLPTYAPRELAGGVRRDVNAATDRLLAAAAQQPARSATFRAATIRYLRAQGFTAEAARLAAAPF